MATCIRIIFAFQVMLAAGISLFSFFFFSPLGGDGGNTGHVEAGRLARWQEGYAPRTERVDEKKFSTITVRDCVQ